MLDRRGESACDEVEDQLGADSGRRHGMAHHRMEMAACDGPLQVGREHVDAHVLAADELLHEGFVLGLGDDALDEGPPLGLDELAMAILGLGHGNGPAGPVPDLLVEQVDEAGHHAVVAVDGQEQGQHPAAADEDALAHRDGLVEVSAVLVEVRDDDRARHAHCLALVPQAGGRGVDSVDRRHHEQGRVRAPEPGAQVAHEICVSGGVEQGDRGALPGDRGNAEAHRTLLADGDGIAVAHRGAVRDGAAAGGRAGGEQQGLHQAGLARPRWSDEDDVANRLGGGGCARGGARGLLVCHGVLAASRWTPACPPGVPADYGPRSLVARAFGRQTGALR